MKTATQSIGWSLMAGAITMTASSLNAATVTGVSITLTSAFQAGDYALIASPSTNSQSTLYQIRNNQVVSSLNIQGTTAQPGVTGATNGEVYTGCTFNKTNGDFYYWTGYGSGGGRYAPGYEGFELYRIKAGTTTSELIISDMTLGTANAAGKGAVVSVAVASNGTIYAMQDMNGSFSNPNIYQYTPSGSTYSAPTLVTTLTGGTILSGGSMDLYSQSGQEYLIIQGGWTGTASRVFSVNLTSPTATIKSSDHGGSTSDINNATGPVNGIYDLAIDYAHPDAQGRLPVLVSNGRKFGTDTANYYVTQLWFNPADGSFVSAAAGTGTIAGTSNAVGVLKMNSSNNGMDTIAFDNEGNLLVTTRYAGANKILKFTADQLGLGGTLLVPDTSTGTSVWNASTNTFSLYGASSLVVAPIVPEPASMGLLGIGTMLILSQRRAH